MKKKITCIVSTRDETEGLPKIFKEFHKEPFINNFLFKLGSGADIHDEGLFLNEQILCNKLPFLFIAKEKVLAARNITAEQWDSDWDFLLVSDDIGDLDVCIKSFDADTLVMYHGYPEDSKAKIEASRCYDSKKGEHELTGIYYELRHVVLAYNEETRDFRQEEYNLAIKNIFQWFGIDMELESVLELLHTCLTPSGAKKIIEWKLSSELGVAEKVGMLAGMSDPFSKKYLEKLSEIREQLLPDKT